MKSLVIVTITLSIFAAAKAFADCGYVNDPTTGNMIFTCDLPTPGTCGYIVDPSTGDLIFTCN